MKRPRLTRSIPRSLPLLDSPLVRRVLWHLNRMRGQLDRRFFMSLAQGIAAFVLIAAVLITLFEKPWTFESIFDSFNWGLATVLGQGDLSYVTSPAGRVSALSSAVSRAAALARRLAPWPEEAPARPSPPPGRNT